MFLTAEKSVKKLYDKAKKVGLLQNLEDHMIKMEKAGAIELVDKQEMEQILNGKRLSNFCSQNYVEKLTSKRSKIRPVNDTSRIIPNLGYSLVDIMESPKNCINTLVNAYMVFTLHQSHCESDIHSAYWHSELGFQTFNQIAQIFIWIFLVEPRVGYGSHVCYKRYA